MSSNDLKVMFDVAFPVTKDLHNVRKSGVMQEDLAEEIIDAFDMKHVESKHDTGGFGYGCSDLYVNADKTVGIYSYNHSMGGIPTWKVGVMNNAQWKDIRKSLKDLNLVR